MFTEIISILPTNLQNSFKPRNFLKSSLIFGNGTIVINNRKIYIRSNDNIQTFANKINNQMKSNGVEASLIKTSYGLKLLLKSKNLWLNIKDPNEALQKAYLSKYIGTDKNCLIQIIRASGNMSADKVIFNYTMMSSLQMNRIFNLVSEYNRFLINDYETNNIVSLQTNNNSNTGSGVGTIPHNSTGNTPVNTTNPTTNPGSIPNNTTPTTPGTTTNPSTLSNNSLINIGLTIGSAAGSSNIVASSNILTNGTGSSANTYSTGSSSSTITTPIAQVSTPLVNTNTTTATPILNISTPVASAVVTGSSTNTGTGNSSTITTPIAQVSTPLVNTNTTTATPILNISTPVASAVVTGSPTNTSTGSSSTITAPIAQVSTPLASINLTTPVNIINKGPNIVGLSNLGKKI